MDSPSHPGIPVATIAPPRKIPPAYFWLGGSLAFGLCACVIGMAIGMSMGKMSANKPQVVEVSLKNPFKGMNDIGKGRMTWQELQDTLRAKGMATRRGEATLGMWFVPEDKLALNKLDTDVTQPLTDSEAAQIYAVSWGGTFVVRDMWTPEAAKEESARIKDVEQRETLAWKNFLFSAADPKDLARVRETLSK